MNINNVYLRGITIEALKIAKEKGDSTYNALKEQYLQRKNETIQDKINRIRECEIEED